MAFARFKAKGEAQALAIVFDRTASELLKVARHLSASPDDAEDLVQATFLTAIESKGSYERGRPVLPWLLGILANQARAHRRSARRQPDPTRVRGDVVADVHAEVSGHELRRELATAIDRLPEAYRAVMRLWLEHGLEAHEIATTLERPSGTVRSQISRGLDMLRQALPASLAGGAAVAVATGQGLAAIRSHLLRECAGTSSGIASALAIGGLFVLHQKLLSAGVVLAIALVSWYVIVPSEPAEPQSVDTNTAAVADSGGVGRLDPAVGEQPARRQPADPVAAPAAAAAPTTSDVIDATASLVVHLCTVSDDAPLSGYGVALRLPEDAENIAIAPKFTMTDALGNVRFDDVEPNPYVIEVDRVGFVGQVAVVGGESIERRFEISEAVTVEGLVVDASGQPVPGADVMMQAERLASPRVAVTDALGRFTARHIRPMCSLLARKSGYSPSPLWVVKGESGQRVQMELQLATAARRISGQVFDDRGQAIGGAAVAVIDAESRKIMPVYAEKPQVPPIWLRSDREGRFSTDEVGASRYIVIARAPKLDTTPSWADVDTRVNDAFVELRSSKSIVIEGSVQRSGQPVSQVRISVWPQESTADLGYLMNLVGMRQCMTDADGAFRIAGVLPGELAIQAWRGANMIGDIRRSVAAGETVRWDLDLDGGNALEIRVTAPGKLSPHLMALIYDTTKPNSAPGMERIGLKGSVRHQRRGTGPVDIVLCLLQGVPNVIQLARREVPPSVSKTHFELGAEDLPTRMLRGRLVDATLAPVAGQTVRARRVGGQLVVVLQTTSEADGSFEIGPLPGGNYSVEAGALGDSKQVGRRVVSSARDEDLGNLTVPK